jgi:hypothetical protein
MGRRQGRRRDNILFYLELDSRKFGNLIGQKRAKDKSSFRKKHLNVAQIYSHSTLLKAWIKVNDFWYYSFASRADII